jgi:hypothetical protein
LYTVQTGFSEIGQGFPDEKPIIVWLVCIHYLYTVQTGFPEIGQGFTDEKRKYIKCPGEYERSSRGNKQGLEKNQVFFKNPPQWVFCFFFVFLVFLYICPEERFLRVFQFQEYF